MSERTEYWWVRHESEIQPAEVGFVGGIPVRFKFIGMAGSIPAESAELIERLPIPPASLFQARPVPTAAAPQTDKKKGSWLWLIGILLLILVAQCSGQIFDMIK
ncbi:hypothetical protein AB4Y85_14690 [Microvirga sp. 2YAF29]|uniref:hypothetical protein n=1 Tax=Microvirga sp. 2YAF29 TaxID=3233031 RepID=UPI003F995B15